MSALDVYFQAVESQLHRIRNEQRGALVQAAEWVSEALLSERFIYVFGSGHSHALGEEMFYRAGGLARAVAILDEKLMVHESASESTSWERIEGYAVSILSRYPLGQGDVLIVVSNSGRNPVPIEMAILAAERGARVLAITSLDYSGSVTSRHSSGKKLTDVAHLVINNYRAAGDACVTVDGLASKVGPT